MKSDASDPATLPFYRIDLGFESQIDTSCAMFGLIECADFLSRHSGKNAGLRF